MALPEVLARIEVDPPSRTLVEGLATVPEALAALEQHGHWIAAIRILGQALPVREAVWWACVCARRAPDPAATPADLAALQATDAWVRRPSEELRRAAMAAAQAAGARSPEAWAAIGAFWSGGSVGPADAPEIPPAPQMCGVAVASAVLLAALRPDPEQAAGRHPAFVASARNIADGGGG
ncbi:hypothetical protein Rmf_41440 [Roseomonas fluvialis]|uniref:Secreted protein n=2 Tax=Roseomonas fluvialis TaxID=1750527 RepID=A0ABN6P6B9_9PROT|nr:hypothetical protein Rmf_41440 [Roseomonas fluvialis]